MGQAVKPGATAVTVTPEPFVWKAVEAAIRPVEFNPTDHSMGYGGLLNILGAVELDASLMHRRSLEAGAVWAVHGHEHVRSLAREVMPRLPHVVLVGPGTEHLAREPGVPRRRLLTARAHTTKAHHSALPISGCTRGADVLAMWADADTAQLSRASRTRLPHDLLSLLAPWCQETQLTVAVVIDQSSQPADRHPSVGPFETVTAHSLDQLFFRYSHRVPGS